MRNKDLKIWKLRLEILQYKTYNKTKMEMGWTRSQNKKWAMDEKILGMETKNEQAK